MQKIIDELYKLSKKAYKKGEVPVSCIIVKENKIVSKAYNLKETKHNPLCHAEILAINKLCKKIKDWRLDDYELYVTLKPCGMCNEVIKSSRIKKVYYLLENNEQSYKINTQKLNLDENKFKELLTTFFKEKR